MTQLKLSRVAAALTPVLAGMTLAFNAHAANEMNKPSAAQAPSAQHGQSAKAQQQMQDVRASRLIGTAVEGSDGQRIGEIEDLIIDLNNQRVHYAVLAHGGFIGVGEKLFAYPMSAFQPAQDDRALRLNVSEQKLKDAPGFDRKNWPNWNKDEYRSSVDRYHGEAEPVKTDENPRYVRASEFIGEDITDRKDKSIGEVEDVIVNMKNGELHYVLVELDNRKADDDRLHVVPPQAFRNASTKDDDLRLTVDPGQLASAPAIEEDALWRINDEKWMRDVDGYIAQSGSARGAVGGTPQRSPETSGTPGGRVQAERTQPQSSEPMNPGGGKRATGTPSSEPAPAEIQQ